MPFKFKKYLNFHRSEKSLQKPVTTYLTIDRKKPRSECCNFGRGILGFAAHFLNSFFICLISSASFSSHSSRVFAYTFRLILLPSTRGEYLPSYKWSLSLDIHPVPALRIFGLYGSNSGFSVLSGLFPVLGILASVPPILRSIFTAACSLIVSVIWLYTLRVVFADICPIAAERVFTSIPYSSAIVANVCRRS